MKLATVRFNAASFYQRETSHQLPASAGYTHDQWRWIGVLGAMEGKTFPVLENIQGGVQGSIYLLIDFDEVTSGTVTRKLYSQVAAISTALIEKFEETSDPMPVTPTEESSPGAWWKEKGLEVVRLVTPWTDRFMAFTQRA